jgi:hypothetical protein
VTSLSYDTDQYPGLPDDPSDGPSIPQLDPGPFSRSKEEDQINLPMSIPPPTPIGSSFRRPPMIETASARRRAYSSGAVLMGNSVVSFGPRESLSPSDASGSYSTNIGPGRGTPKRGSIFTAKSHYRDFGDKSE